MWVMLFTPIGIVRCFELFRMMSERMICFFLVVARRCMIFFIGTVTGIRTASIIWTAPSENIAPSSIPWTFLCTQQWTKRERLQFIHPSPKRETKLCLRLWWMSKSVFAPAVYRKVIRTVENVLQLDFVWSDKLRKGSQDDILWFDGKLNIA